MIYLAALQSLPPDLYEAAELDGAGAFQKFRAITFPLLTPTTFFLLVTGFIGASQSFGMINLMTEWRSGPVDDRRLLLHLPERFPVLSLRLRRGDGLVHVRCSSCCSRSHSGSSSGAA